VRVGVVVLGEYEGAGFKPTASVEASGHEPITG